MRKCFVLLILLSSITLPIPVLADEKHVDYNHSDGSRTRVTYTTDNSGNTSVKTTNMSKAEVEKESMAKGALQLVGLVIWAIIKCTSSK